MDRILNPEAVEVIRDLLPLIMLLFSGVVGWVVSSLKTDGKVKQLQASQGDFALDMAKRSTILQSQLDEQKAASAKQNLRIDELEDELKTTRANWQRTNDELEATRLKLADTEKRLREAMLQIDQERTDRNAQDERLSQMQEELNVLRGRVTEIQAAYRLVVEQKEALEQEKRLLIQGQLEKETKLFREIAELNLSIDDLNRKVGDLETRNKQLRAALARYMIEIPTIIHLPAPSKN